MAAIGGDGADPKKVVIVSMTGASHSELDTDIPGAETDSVRAGHEPDRFKVKSILAVPALLTVVVVLAFGIVTALFVGLYTRFVPTPAGGSNPQAVEVNTVAAADGKGRQDRDVSERFARIGSTAPKDVPGLAGTAVPQPRLEYLKQTTPETKDDPAFERSKRPVESASNTYEIRPEDLRPDNYTDPVTKEKVLATYGWVDAGKKVARVPVAEAMRMILADPKKLPVRKNPLTQVGTSINTPTLSNGGLPPGGAVADGKPTPPPAEKPHADKPHDDHKH